MKLKVWKWVYILHYKAEVYEKTLNNADSTSNAFKIGNSYKETQFMTPNEIELNKIKENYFKDRYNSVINLI